MNKNIEKTHRCDKLLMQNKENRGIIRIFYGYRFDNPYNEKNGETKGWYLAYLVRDTIGTYAYMRTVCRITHCPLCGMNLERKTCKDCEYFDFEDEYSDNPHPCISTWQHKCLKYNSMHFTCNSACKRGFKEKGIAKTGKEVK